VHNVQKAMETHQELLKDFLDERFTFHT